jgi:formate hydrogenlyase subunit 3/multisubunit Na+/H+ antiporter MnhD subunit
VLWIVFPGLVAGCLYLLRRWKQGILITGVLVAATLSWLGWQLPVGESLAIGPWSLEISDTLWILGRRFVLTNAERPLLAVIYLAAAFWFGGSLAARTNSIFVPAGLGVVSLMTASFAVDPFLYAALFIEMAALLCIPLLATPRQTAGRGVLRFLTFQTLGTPFILFTGWVTASIQSNPTQSELVLRGALLAGLGFSFLLAVFPFHTWMPMLSDESHPFPAAFVFYMLPGSVFLFGIKFLGMNEWLSGFFWVPALLQAAGGLMIVTGGIWAAFQRRLGRMLAYAMMVEIGLSFLVIELQRSGSVTSADGSGTGNTLFLSLFISRGLALGVWALALSVFRQQAPSLRFWDVRGLGRRFPVAACALILAHFSLAGFPLLAGFPIRLSLIDGLAASAPLAAFWILIGMVGLFIGALRTLAVLVMGAGEEPWTISESRLLRLLLLAGMAGLVLAGVIPLF